LKVVSADFAFWDRVEAIPHFPLRLSIQISGLVAFYVPEGKFP